jgi:hypothetical protein
MQNLLSKDVLYPSLKEITEKVREFPLLAWILTSVYQLVGHFAETMHSKGVIWMDKYGFLKRLVCHSCYWEY